jgi:DNA modification methylase
MTIYPAMAAVKVLETGVVYCDDNLRRLRQFPDQCVDLVYLDPPFFSNRNYEVIWGDEAEVRSFEDRWEGGIQVYLGWMEVRLRQLHRVLKGTGSLYLHCDAAAGHYLKVLLDDIFGIGNFRNEVIWRRTGSNKSVARFGPIHQTILYYGKSRKSPFYPVHGPYTKGYIEGYFDQHDDRGRYRPVLLTGPSRRDGASGKPWRGYDPTASGRHWQPATYVYTKYRQVTGEDLAQYPLLERLDKLDEIGLVHWPKKARGVPNYRFYLDDAPGVAYQDIWSYQPGTEGCVYGHGEGIDRDVKWLSTRDRERVGYPTQKPEGVLERIIRASSQEGDIVLDPFCGCGTTVAVAQRLRREWVGIDISPTATGVMKQRLSKLGAIAKVEGLPVTLDDLKALGPFEFQNWVIQRVHGEPSPKKSGDMGIDGFSFFELLPIQVKQSERIGRKVVDEFETAVRRCGKHKGYIVAFSFTRGAKEEAVRARREGIVEIELVEVDRLLQDQTARPTPQIEDLFPALPKSFLDLPLPPPRPKASLPSAEELIRSDKSRCRVGGALGAGGHTGRSHRGPARQRRRRWTASRSASRTRAASWRSCLNAGAIPLRTPLLEVEDQIAGRIIVFSLDDIGSPPGRGVDELLKPVEPECRQLHASERVRRRDRGRSG